MFCASASGEGSEASTQTPVVRTRYAPSPTGSLHLGGLRTALFNYLWARKHGPESAFLVRIEDTDRTRTIPGAADNLLETMARFGLKADEPVEQQSDRTELYRKHADELLEQGHAYRCFCSAERLAEVRAQQSRHGKATAYDRKCRGISAEDSDARAASGESFTVRLRAPLTGRTQVDDLVCGRVSFENKVMDDQVLLKSDGFPTYHLASVVDDHDMRITHVIRGEEWLSSTPKHLTLYSMFGWTPPQFAHLPLLLNTDRSKLSKRNADSAVTELLGDGGAASGYSTMAILNFVALLGWSPAQAAMAAAAASLDSNENADGIVQDKSWLANFAEAPEGDDARESMIFTDLESLASAFDLAHATRKGAVVDPDFLHWLSGQHVRRQDRASLIEALRSQLGWDSSSFSDEYADQVLDLILFRVFRVRDLHEVAAHFFAPPGRPELVFQDDKVSSPQDSVAPKETMLLALEVGAETLSAVDDFSPKNLKAALKRLPKEVSQRQGAKVKVPHVMLSVRWATTGATVGASLPETLALLGRERVVERLQHARSIIA
ncbi:Glutamate--tRNA ligase [Hondaea fermentalgiana]|uniref:glutamate--tRNA ligase n=1 Tax=Hondaea fermentalgiana TaxID=2315210 RepID=A0A2R5GTE3_9STRA|nr:Glutamate--tRNA ligase [Hondaea fermentalgiana]|eukprot:GBG34132.1 Glutamate--tRNA ligase [Hondaea fermentalgiana]